MTSIMCVSYERICINIDKQQQTYFEIYIFISHEVECEIYQKKHHAYIYHSICIFFYQIGLIWPYPT